MRMVFVRCTSNDSVVAVRRRRTAAGVRAVIVRVVFRAWRRVCARVPLPRTGEGDQSRNNAAEQRKEDDGLIHGACVSPSSN